MKENIIEAFLKLKEKLFGWLDALILNLPNFIFAVIVFGLTYWGAQALQGWARKYLKKVIKQPSIRNLVSTGISVVGIIVGLILALSILNLNDTLQSLLAGAGITGLAISLALQGTLSNTFSGVFIAIKEELNIGDYIYTNGYAGTVMEINLRNTKIKESDNNIVVIPNKMILENPFKNLGLTERIRTTINCGVHYDSDLKKVQGLAIQAIKEKFPPNEEENIEFYFTDFNESSIDFMIRFWVDATRNLTALEVKSEAIMIIKETFDNHEIVIPFPIRTIIQDS